jgi:hypothetical protein
MASILRESEHEFGPFIEGETEKESDSVEYHPMEGYPGLSVHILGACTRLFVAKANGRERQKKGF